RLQRPGRLCVLAGDRPPREPGTGVPPAADRAVGLGRADAARLLPRGPRAARTPSPGACTGAARRLLRAAVHPALPARRCTGRPAGLDARRLPRLAAGAAL